MKKILMVLVCVVVLGTFMGCEDKVKDKAADKETKKPQQTMDADENSDKKPDGLGGNLTGYVDESRKSHDKVNCDYIKSCLNASMNVEDVHLELVANEGSKWMLITFEDGMRLDGNEDYSNLKVELESILYALSEPKVKGKVGYLVTWTVDDQKVIKDIKVETVDEKTAAEYVTP